MSLPAIRLYQSQIRFTVSSNVGIRLAQEQQKKSPNRFHVKNLNDLWQTLIW